MKLPRRPVLLALLALAAPLPALAGSDESLEPATGPVALAVTTTLDSCGIDETQVVCKLNVSYNELSNASSYTASVTRADGSVVDYGSVAPGGATLWVPYVGAGNYSVTVTAYGTPEEPGAEGEEIATDVSGADAESDEGKLETGDATELDAEADGRGEPAANEGDLGGAGGEGDVEADATCTETPELPTAPVPSQPAEPPADLDPADPDEDGDKILDADEVAEYERLVAEREQAIAAAEAAELPESIDCK